MPVIPFSRFVRPIIRTSLTRQVEAVADLNVTITVPELVVTVDEVEEIIVIIDDCD